MMLFMLGNKVNSTDVQSLFAEIEQGDVVKVTPFGEPTFLAFYKSYDASNKWAFFKAANDTAARALPTVCIASIEVLVLNLDTMTTRVKSVTVPAQPASQPAPAPSMVKQWLLDEASNRTRKV